MLNKLIYPLIITGALFTVLPCERVFSEVPAPTPFNTYDGQPPGSRPLGMGLAFSAVGEDPSSLYFNPAGLAIVSGSLFSMTYEASRQSALTAEQLMGDEVLKGRNLIFLSLNSQRGSFAWRPLANASFRTVTATGYEDVQVKVNAYTISASHTAEEGLKTGLNLSYLSGQIARAGMDGGAPFARFSDGNGFAMDIGFIYPLSSDVQAGFNFQNLLGFMWWEDFEKDQLPFTLRAGLAFQITDFMNFAADLEKRYYRKEEPLETKHFGLEQNIGGTLALRAGIYGTDLNDRESTHLCAGLGYKSKSYELSLAGEKYRMESNDVYRYVLSLNLPL